MLDNIPEHGHWSGRLVFILAVSGSAISLGNIWRFPYMAGEYGGGIFVITYLVFLLLIGLPIMMAEIMLGRMGGHSPIYSIRKVAETNGQHRYWQVIGWLGAIAGFLILSLHSVFASWSMGYIFRAASGAFEGVSVDGVKAVFGFFINDPEKQLAWHTLFMLGTYYVVSRGVNRGLEPAIKVLMPLLLLILLVLLGHAVVSDSFTEGVRFFLLPDLGRISYLEQMSHVILAAMGQAFFTLSLGAGAIMAYGAYLPKNIPIMSTTLTIVLLDTCVAIIAGMIIFPLLFSTGLHAVDVVNGLPGQYGPELIFQTLPLAFGQIPGGVFYAAVFFLLLVLVAWTSAIALLEPFTAYLVERFSFSRQRAAGMLATMAWLLGIATLLSFNEWSDFRLLGNVAIFADKTIYQLLDFLASNILLPLGGLMIAIFAGWVLDWHTTEDELAHGQGYSSYAIWRFCIRYITPLLLVIVFCYSLLKALGEIPGVP